MPIKPLERISVAESIYRQLRDAILQGELQPGDALPGERVLSEQLKVNRAAVREALKRLEQSRLVSIHQGGNTRICDFRRTATLEIVNQLLVDPAGRIDQKVARSMVEMRAAITPDIARLAAERAPVACAAELKGIVAAMRSSDGDVSRLRSLGEEFWATLAFHADNVAYQLVLNTVREVHDTYAPLLERLLRERYLNISGFEQLYDAIEAGNSAAVYEIAQSRSRSIVDSLGAISEQVRSVEAGESDSE